MNPLDIVTLEAFIAALAQLDHPLPSDLQTALHQLGPTLATDIGQLDEIAERYPPLNDCYQDMRAILQDHARERIAGPIPQPDEAAEQLTPELDNTAQLVHQVVEILSSSEPLTAAQTEASQDNSPLHQLMTFIRRSST